MKMTFRCTCTRCLMCTRRSAPALADPRSKSASREPARAPCREPVDHRSGSRGSVEVVQLDDPLEAGLQVAIFVEHPPSLSRMACSIRAISRRATFRTRTGRRSRTCGHAPSSRGSSGPAAAPSQCLSGRPSARLNILVSIVRSILPPTENVSTKTPNSDLCPPFPF